MANDSKESTVKLYAIKESITLKDLINSTDECDKKDPYVTVSVDIVDKVIAFIDHHSYDNDSDSINSSDDDSDDDRRLMVSLWDQNFFKVEQNTMFDLVMVANCLGIKDLMDVGCKTMANQIRGKTPEQIQELWGIKCDLSDEQVQQLKIDNAWTLLD